MIQIIFNYFLVVFQKELKDIAEKDFDTLWQELWIHTETINPRIKRV